MHVQATILSCHNQRRWVNTVYLSVQKQHQLLPAEGGQGGVGVLVAQ